MKKYRLPLACALVVLLSLALPFAVFSLWDKALLSAPHSQTAAEGLSAEARANSTACNHSCPVSESRFPSFFYVITQQSYFPLLAVPYT